MRIVLMVLRLLLRVPYYFFGICWYGRSSNTSFEKAFAFIKKVTKAANHAGRVTIEPHGLDHFPEKDGFVIFPNHQGMFDILVFLDSCPRPVSFVMKKEVKGIILLKQVARALKAYSMDREDIRQSMEIINAMTEDVKQGRNFVIFAEGTRSRMGNQLLDFKGGSFKSATRAKSPIIPCALIDSFKPFDENSIKPVTVKVIYLPPIYYEEYQGMKTTEIAAEVKRRIEEAIARHTA